MTVRPGGSKTFDIERGQACKPLHDWQLNTHISIKNRYVFFQVCKAGGSTVTYHLQSQEFCGSMWRVQDPRNKHLSPHLSPFQLPDDLLAAAMTSSDWKRVTFVRDPFSRLLSCYLHRIIARPDSASAKHLRQVSGLGRNPTFEQFVRVVCAQPSNKMERHWRVHADEVLIDLVDLDFVGRIERTRQDLEGLLLHLFGRQAFDERALNEINASPMKTNANERFEEYYSDRLVEAVVERYQRDFETFGYSTELGGSGP